MTLSIAREIQFELENQIEGEVRFDNVSKVLYSTDASIYQIEPIGVVFPKTQSDVIAVVSWAAQNNVPILPRGSGSSLAGQTVGAALVIDFTRYLNVVEDVNLEEKTAWVQPGLVLAEFNNQIRQSGLQFGPDPASGERASMGGICGNNSTGAHSILYGMAVDHILEMDVVMSDGNLERLGSMSVEEAEKLSKGTELLSGVLQKVLAIRNTYADVIRTHWPKTWRNASGYALNYMIPWSSSSPSAWTGNEYPPGKPGSLNLAQLLVGSEGTLGVFSRMKVGLVDIPQEKVLAVLEFESVVDASRHTPELLTLGPSAVELVPRAILEKARAVPAYASRLSFLKGNPAAILLVEFAGDDKNLLVEQAKRLGSGALVITDPVKQKQLWEVRKVGLGLLMYMVGDAKPIPFIEDIAVPVEKLGEFVTDFERVLADHGTSGNFYAHASAGCLHIRPVINTKSEADVKKMVSISEQMVALTLQYGGALSGEHGDGLARAVWLEEIYGSEIVDVFQQVKTAFDPKGILNPGKVVDVAPMDENLRYGEDYNAQPWQPVIDFSYIDGVGGAIEMCNGAGVCRKDTGTMCPTFQASREEMHSTRGRANLLREYISGKLLPSKQAEEAAFQALEMCLACKACKAECPSAVDVAVLKYEFMNHYYKSHARPLGDYLFGYIGEFAGLGQYFPGMVNWLTQSQPGKFFMEKVFGISRERTLPAIASRGKRNLNVQLSNAREKVIVLSDPFSAYFTPELMEDLLSVLAAVEVEVVQLSVIGTGRTKMSKGFLESSIKHAKELVAEIKRIDPEHKLPILGIEPSEIVMLTDDILNMLPDDEEVKEIARRTFSLAEFMVRPDETSAPRYKRIELHRENPSILLHGHCYQKAQKLAVDGIPNGLDADVLLFEALGCQVEVIESGCCGMAGSFGYEKDHLEMSKLVAEKHLLPAVRAKKKEQQVVASGASCRSQIDSLANEEALHLIQILARMIE